LVEVKDQVGELKQVKVTKVKKLDAGGGDNCKGSKVGKCLSIEDFLKEDSLTIAMFRTEYAVLNLSFYNGRLSLTVKIVTIEKLLLAKGILLSGLRKSSS
jgi:hypothetical protein